VPIGLALDVGAIYFAGVTGGDGKVLRTVGVFIDILTERR